LLWFRHFTGDIGGHSIVIDKDQNLYFSIDFATLESEGISLPAGGGVGGGEILIIKFDSLGKIAWQTQTKSVKDSQSSWGNYVSGGRLALNSKGQLMLIGNLVGGHSFGPNSIFGSGYGDLFIAKLSQDNTLSVPKTLSSENINFNIFPNPSGEIFTLNFYLPETEQFHYSVTDAQGRRIYTSAHQKLGGEVRKEIDLRDQAAGIYFLEVFTGSKRTVQKLVKH
jgi:hypothetical protein